MMHKEISQRLPSGKKVPLFWQSFSHKPGPFSCYRMRNDRFLQEGTGQELNLIDGALGIKCYTAPGAPLRATGKTVLNNL